MKLAEALLLRADRNRSLEQLKQRIAVSPRYQEGERPPEDARDLVTAASAVLDELEALIRDINRTNSGTVMPDGRTVTDALAERDVLRLRYSMLKVSADAASGGSQQVGYIRATRSELEYLQHARREEAARAGFGCRSAGSRARIRGFSRSTGQPSSSRHERAIVREVGRKGRRASSSPFWGPIQKSALNGSGSARAAHRGSSPRRTGQPSTVHSSRRIGHRASPGTDYVRTEGGSGDSHTIAQVKARPDFGPCDFVRSQLRSAADRGISPKRGAEVDAPFICKCAAVEQAHDQEAAEDR